jgi:hypothetical protein
MMRTTVINFILIFLIHTISHSQNISDLSGKWVSEKDKLSVIEFKENTFYEFYDNELVDKGSFFFSNNCKVKGGFLQQNKPLYLNQISSDNSMICNEIMSFTKNRLILMYSENGKISTFIKVKPVKRRK